jgi:hypothetical protein
MEERRACCNLASTTARPKRNGWRVEESDLQYRNTPSRCRRPVEVMPRQHPQSRHTRAWDARLLVKGLSSKVRGPEGVCRLVAR